VLKHSGELEPRRIANLDVREPRPRQLVDGRERAPQDRGQARAVNERWCRLRRRRAYALFELAGDELGEVLEEANEGGSGKPSS